MRTVRVLCPYPQCEGMVEVDEDDNIGVCDECGCFDFHPSDMSDMLADAASKRVDYAYESLRYVEGRAEAVHPDSVCNCLVSRVRILHETGCPAAHQTWEGE